VLARLSKGYFFLTALIVYHIHPLFVNPFSKIPPKTFSPPSFLPVLCATHTTFTVFL